MYIHEISAIKVLDSENLWFNCVILYEIIIMLDYD